jgi:hypothetical protein
MAATKGTRVLATGEEALPCKLTDAERLERANELGELHRQRRALEQDLEQLRGDYKGRITAKKGRITELLDVLESGSERRSVATETVANYSTGLAETRRKDNGEIIGRRSLTDDERQMQFGGGVGSGGPQS